VEGNDYGIDESRPSKLNDSELVKLIDNWYKDSSEGSETWRKEAREDFNFVAGHQWDEDAIVKLEDDGRPVVTFNRIQVLVSAIMGIEANQRQETKYVPRENEDTGVSEALSETLKWLQDYSDIESEEADAFEDLVVCGLGWTESRMDYEEDLDGKFIEERTDPLEMYWDVTAKKKNLKDRRYQIRKRKMKIQDVREIWDDVEDIVMETLTSKDGLDLETTVVNPETRYDQEEEGRNTRKKLIEVKHTEWWEREPVYRIANPQDGRIMELSEAEYKKNKEDIDMLEEMGSPLLKQKRKVYYYAFSAGSTLLESGKLDTQSGFTFKCMTGKHDKVFNTWYGVVRAMKDPAIWSNKFFSQIMDILSTNAKGGILVEENTFADPKKAEDEWAMNNSITTLKPNAIKDKRIMPKPVIQYPQGLDRLMEFSIHSIRDVSGINLELLGMADRNQPGVLEETRKKAGYTILATLFDSLRSYRKEQGTLTLEFIKEYLPVNRIQSVLSDEYKPYAEQIKNIDLMTTDVIVTESPQSENNKTVTWSFLMQLVPSLIQAGLPVPPDVLEYSPLPKPLVEKWTKLIEAQGKPSPEQQEQQRLAMEEVQANIRKTMADAGKTEVEIQEVQAKTQKLIAEAVEMRARTGLVQSQAFGQAIGNAIEVQGGQSER
jgi:hypothetical protein